MFLSFCKLTNKLSFFAACFEKIVKFKKVGITFKNMSDYDPNYVGLGKLMENYEKIGSGADGRQERRYLRNAAIAEILRDSIGEDGSGKLDLRKETVIERLEAKGIKEGLSP